MRMSPPSLAVGVGAAARPVPPPHVRQVLSQPAHGPVRRRGDGGYGEFYLGVRRSELGVTAPTVAFASTRTSWHPTRLLTGPSSASCRLRGAGGISESLSTDHQQTSSGLSNTVAASNARKGPRVRSGGSSRTYGSETEKRVGTSPVVQWVAVILLALVQYGLASTVATEAVGVEVAPSTNGLLVTLVVQPDTP